MRVHLVRHGETEWSAAGRHTGLTDLALTPRGEQQAKRLASPLAHVQFTKVLTSPLQRARHTCALAGLAGAADIDPDLLEWNYGEYEGLTTAVIHQHRPGWNVFLDGCPGGETPPDIERRADRVIDRLHDAGGSVALFSHGHFGCALAARWLDLPIEQAARFLLGTASISVLGHGPHQPAVRVLESWNRMPWQDACERPTGKPQVKASGSVRPQSD